MIDWVRAELANMETKRQQFAQYQPTLAEFLRMHGLPAGMSAFRPVAGIIILIGMPSFTVPRVFWSLLILGSAVQLIFDILDGYIARKLAVGCQAGGTFDLYCDYFYGAFVVALIGKACMHDYTFALTCYGIMLLYVALCWKSASFRKRFGIYYLLFLGTGYCLGLTWTIVENGLLAQIRLRVVGY
jgi:hypothetical protein